MPGRVGLVPMFQGQNKVFRGYRRLSVKVSKSIMGKAGGGEGRGVRQQVGSRPMEVLQLISCIRHTSTSTRTDVTLQPPHVLTWSSSCAAR